jgi:hypothetical protein
MDVLVERRDQRGGREIAQVLGLTKRTVDFHTYMRARSSALQPAPKRPIKAATGKLIEP